MKIKVGKVKVASKINQVKPQDTYGGNFLVLCGGVGGIHID